VKAFHHFSQREEIENMFKEVTDFWGTVDILVNK